jgi:hypothetical protein
MRMNRLLRWGVVLLVVVLLALSAGCQAINDEPAPEPEPVPEPPPSGDVNIYVAGYLHSGSSIYTPCYWKNGIRIDLIPLGATDNIPAWEWLRGVSGYAHSIFVDGNDVYVAGYVNLEKNDHLFLPCYWKNGVRSDLDIGDAAEGFAYSIFISDGNVYVCGQSRILGYPLSTFIPCYWMNGRRIDLPFIGSHGDAKSIFVSQKDVYIPGNFWSSSRVVDIFGYWKNGVWTELFSADSFGHGGLDSIFVVGNDVFAAGWTDSASTQNVPSYWKNSIRTNLSVLDPPRSGRANAMVVFGSDAFVAGWTKNDLIVSVPCYWT